jgi:error-prone DNA polymerase
MKSEHEAPPTSYPLWSTSGRRTESDAAPPADPRLRSSSCDYVELHARSAFSFLRAASLPEDLAEAAAAQGHAVFGVADVGGFYGAPRFHLAATRAGVRPIVGAELEVDGCGLLTLLCEDRQGYKNLSRLLTMGHKGRAKTDCRVSGPDLAERRHGLVALCAGTPQELVNAASYVGTNRLYAELQRHRDPAVERDNKRRLDAARARGVPVVAGGGVRHATAAKKPLFDALTCIRLGLTLDGAGRKLLRNAERHVHTPQEMAARFIDLPDAIANTRAVAERCAYTLGDLDYRFPTPPLEYATTIDGELWHRTLEGARRRYGSGVRWPPALAQIERELALIAKLDLAGYFLIVHDLIRFCAREGILVQGRGSAANSAVCYSLGITAVDPVGMGLLFERFLSEERRDSHGHKTWPDIDLDLPSGTQREKVIQHVYQRFGEAGAAMTANVITYRSRSSSREIGKVLGLPQQELDRMSKLLPHFEFKSDDDTLGARAREAGFAPEDPRVKLYLDLCTQISGLPRHLGQHSGGMVICTGRLDEVVPLEPASMEGRTVVQWDKDDCADLGIIKIDLLGLGMMAVLEQAVPLVRAHEGVEVDLAQLPPDDPDIYRMLQTADTIGLFQVESRAQMATLPRMMPRCFYDIVVEVAIIRPGPIVGNLVHPFLERRNGRQKVTYAHPDLEPILKRTLGVPLFQEQLMRVAMVAGDFTGGEADELRRAMGSKRSIEKMQKIETKLRAGMTKNGLSQAAQDEIVKGITSFALYGFPESHAASFALIVYASAYLKAHHPQAFLTAMLNCWPMGFYSPATLVKDSQRHGVRVKPIDASRSGWLCALERSGPEEELCVRLGLRYVGGLREAAGQRLVEERARGPFLSIGDLAARTGLRREELAALAEIGALANLPLRKDSPHLRPARRAALWQAEAASRRGPGLLAQLEERDETAEPDEEAEAERELLLGSQEARKGEDASGAEAGDAAAEAARRFAFHNRSRVAIPVVEPAPRAAAQAGSVTDSVNGSGPGAAPVEQPGLLHGHPRDQARDALLRVTQEWRKQRAIDGPRKPQHRPQPAPQRPPQLSPLREMTDRERTAADLRGTGLTIGPHPVEHERARLTERGVVTAAALRELPGGQRVRVGGLCIVRQRPGTAKGFVFLSLEDETGISNVIIEPEIYEAWRAVVLGSAFLVVEGRLEKRDGVINVKGDRFYSPQVEGGVTALSRDFH